MKTRHLILATTIALTLAAQALADIKPGYDVNHPGQIWSGRLRL